MWRCVLSQSDGEIEKIFSYSCEFSCSAEVQRDLLDTTSPKELQMEKNVFSSDILDINGSALMIPITEALKRHS